MNVIFNSLVLICTTTLLYATQNCHARSTSTTTQVYTSEPTVPTIPEFNCDPDKLFMCDRLEKVQFKMELVGLCQEQLAGETVQGSKLRGMDQLLGLLFSRVAVPCSRNDWSVGSRKLGEALKELETIVALVKPFADSGKLFASSFPGQVMLEQIDCLKNQDKYFADYSRYVSSSL